MISPLSAPFPLRGLRWAAIFAGVAIGLVGLRAESRVAPDGRIMLRVYGLADAYSTAPNDIADLRVVEAFRRSHPAIGIEPAAELQVEGLGTEIGPLMAIAGGIAPDVLAVNFRKIDSYIRQGILYPMDDYVARETARDPDWKQRVMVPQVEHVLQMAGGDAARHYYAMPYRYKVVGLRYNRDLFRQAGLPMRGPKDWEELVDFGRKIQALNPENKGLLLNIGVGAASWNLMNFLWPAGGDAVQEIAPGEWRAVFDSEAAVDAFEFYYRLTEGDKLAYRAEVSNYMKTAEARRVGMLFYYNVGDRVANYDPNIWGFSTVPAGPHGGQGAELNAMMLGIFGGLKSREVRDAAWEYIRFVCSEEAQRIRTDALVELGAPDQAVPSDLEKYGHAASLELVPPDFRQQFTQALASAHPEPYGKNCNLIFVEMGYPVDEVLLSPVVAQAWTRGDRAAVRAEIGRILHAAVRKTNERMLGVIPPDRLQHRRWVAWSVVAGLLLGFGVMGRAIFRSFARAGRTAARAHGRQVLLAWLMLAVPLGLAFFWYYVPLVRGGFIALLDYQLLLKSTFVGIDNFANTLFDERFWNSMWVTFQFAGWMLTLGFATPIGLAYLLHIIPRHKLLFRTVYYLPALLTGTAVFVLWKELFSANGAVNSFLSLVGIHVERAWPQDPHLAMLSCVLPAVWAGAGPGCLVYLAALKTIPEEQFEASEIDGAGFWSKTRHIVIPSLGPLVLINFVGAMMAAFQASQNILIMTAGGPNGLTEVAALRIFFQAFMFLQFGPATAMAWILGSILVGFGFLQLRRLSELEFRAGR